MGINEFITELKGKSQILDNVRRYLKLKPHPDYSFYDYLGVNFDVDGIKSFKFYFTFFEPITEDIGKLFLDDLTEFNKYLPLWKPTQKRHIENSGFTFTLKVDANFETTKGFHFRFPYNSDAFPATASFQLDPASLINVGINFEYGKKTIFTKYYYYFNREANKQKFAIRFNKSFVEGADLIEYTESDKFNKIIAWDFNENKFFQHFYSAEKKWPSQEEVIKRLVREYGYYNKSGHGFYENDSIRSGYYFNYKFPEDGRFAENFQIFTISDFLERIKD